jgi:hypothetical protein
MTQSAPPIGLSITDQPWQDPPTMPPTDLPYDDGKPMNPRGMPQAARCSKPATLPHVAVR